ncbi:MAG: cobalt-zinc-cadmium efflux system protein [Flavobacteriaceae bacterium]|jgi:cobalt-zinc-cadmium efflux system protein
MGHHHGHDHSVGKIRLAFFINLAFSIIELIGGLYTNSIAIMTDALHDLGDCMSLGVSWYFQNISHKQQDRKFSYGYGRFSVLGALVNSIVLTVGSIYILSETIPRFFNPEMPNTTGMIYFAIGGIFANGLSAWKLHGGASLNERAVYLHLLEDVLGWVATLIGAIIMYYWDVPWVDPLLALGIAVFILFNVGKNLKEALKILLQATPKNIDTKDLEVDLKKLKGVIDTHDCHLWSLDGQWNIFTIHFVVDDSKTMESLAQIKKEAKALCEDRGIDHVTIEFETKEESCDPC